MHRYPAASCGTGVGNSTLGGGGARETARSDLPYPSSSIALNSRRPLQLTPYKPKCDREFLNSRLGPPEFYPPTFNCPEETLTPEAVQSGYKEAVDGIEDAKETTLTLTSHAIWSKQLISRYKESIRKRLRAINDARVQKRKAGQVYGVALSGSYLTKPGLFPDQRTCGEDSKRKWIEGLSQPLKRLRSLADHVPHGYRKKALFEALIKHKVPLLRATWFIKITYLNQIRSSEKTPGKRVELWTKDFLEYLESLLDEYCQNDGAVSGTRGRVKSPQMVVASGHHQACDPSHTSDDSEGSSLHRKWGYMVRILRWHCAEGLLHRPKVIDWVLSQLLLQEKESLEALELLLPIVFELIDNIALSQTYVRMLVDVSVRWLNKLCPCGTLPDSKAHACEAYNAIFLSELLRYLIITVPDTFVALDCFPLPSCVSPSVEERCISSFTMTMGAEKAPAGVGVIEKMDTSRNAEMQISERELSIAGLVSSIRKRAANLSKAVNPEILHSNEGRVVQVLDKALFSGDVRSAYRCIFEESFVAKNNPDEWLSGVSPRMRSSLNFLGELQDSEVYAIFFLFKWATCDFRHRRDILDVDRKVTGQKDFSRVYMAVSVMNMKLEAMQKLVANNGGEPSDDSVRGVSNTSIDDGFTSRKAALKFDVLEYIYENLQNKYFTKMSASYSVFLAHRCLHDAVVAWLDQHDLQKGEAFKRIQVLLLELIRLCVFQPHAYVRQLIISGTMDKIESVADIERANKHRRILEHLPASSLFHAFEDIATESDHLLPSVIRIYSNERYFALNGCLDRKVRHIAKEGENVSSNSLASTLDGDASVTFEKKRKVGLVNRVVLRGDKSEKRKLQQVAEIKHAISVLLRFPDSFIVYSGKPSSMKNSSAQGKVKRPLGLHGNRTEKGEGTFACDECGRSKKQKISEEKGLHVKGLGFHPTDDDETWWIKKEPKVLDAVKIEQPLKPTKQASRGRQKTVRKTQSLAQLAAARIEGSQGASSSHVCDSKGNCPHHKPNLGGEALLRVKDGNKLHHAGDLQAIGKAMKKLRLTEKWSIAAWLYAVVKQLMEGREKVPIKPNQSSGQAVPVGAASAASDGRSSMRWQLTEDEIAIILYILDISMDLRSVINFLLWLLSKVPIPSHTGRSISGNPWNREGDTCEVGEVFILSCLQRYENTLAAADLIPEALTVGMRRATVMISMSGGRSACPTSFYVRNLLKKYGGLPSVTTWEKKFKTSCDQSLVSEMESFKTSESESAFGLMGGSTAASSEDSDDHLRQKISGRLSRMGPSMKETVQRRINEAIQHIFNKEREFLVATKNFVNEKRDDGHQMVQHTLASLVEWIRQYVGGSPQADASVVAAAAVAAVVGNVGPATVSMLDSAACSAYSGSSSVLSLFSIKCARRVIQIHIHCLRMLKDALGERQNRVLEMFLATEASSTIAAAFVPVKASRSQFQLSPETPDMSSTITNEMLSSSTKGFLGRATRAAAAVAALVVGSVVHGITNLERIIASLRIREGLEVSQLLKYIRPGSNGLSRAAGPGNSSKVDCSSEVYLYWFRVLISNCKTVSDGLVADLLGEPNVLALARMQHMMPLNSILPPVYSIFAMVVWKHHLSYVNVGSRDDYQFNQSFQFIQSLVSAVAEAIRHEPIRNVCLRDTHAFYNYLASYANDLEFSATLEMQGLDMHSKIRALVPLSGRLFLRAILDCQMPKYDLLQDEGNWIHGNPKGSPADEPSLVDQLVHVLDSLQPARFHWQWVELRLLLNEQVLMEKIEKHNISVVEAMRAVSLGVVNNQLSESEKTFIEIVLTRLLVRPDAASLYSEVLHLLGKSFEEYLILHARWVLEGSEVLLGRKSLKQQLELMARRGGFSVKTRQTIDWSWSSPQCDTAPTEVDKKKTEAASPEEGEVADEGTDLKRDGKQSYTSPNVSEMECCYSGQHFTVERALANLVLPCLARSSTDTCTTFAIDLVKQVSLLEQHVNMPSKNVVKSPSGAPVVSEASGVKTHGSRKGLRGGSPGLGRRPTGATETSPSSVAALHVSMWLRLQFLLPLLPQIHADRDLSVHNMRHTLAPVLLRLLGTRVVQEAVDPFSIHVHKKLKKDSEFCAEVSAASASAISGESLFDRFLSILNALLSSTWSSWLKPKEAIKPIREVPAFDLELAERMQADLDHMQLPSAIRVRLQAAMPVLPSSAATSVCCAPPHLSASTVPVLQMGVLNTSSFPSGNLGPSQRISPRMPNPFGKCKSTFHQDPEVEIDPWTMLEDGTGSGVGGSNSGGSITGDQANLKACNWLKGGVRVRRTDLTYVGAVDDDT